MKPAEPVMRRVWLFCDIFFVFFLAIPPAADAFADAFVFAVEGVKEPSRARGGIHAAASIFVIMTLCFDATENNEWRY